MTRLRWRTFPTKEVRPFHSQANQTVSKLLPGKTIGRTCMTVFLKLFQFTLSLTDSPEVGHRGRESIYTKQAESLNGDPNSVKQIYLT